ncbi:MAG TPA: hypothetical protein VFP12_13450 [Allosphingosinicella sp.]|nr:hypothetical protein [Allosphingosinicella sp.]
MEPVAITVDARQRVLLSQLDKRSSDPLFRRYCAEPSPDVFTVLGVSGSGSGSLGLGADKSVNAALQAAFSSSETGATIARTQTLNMLREMMFRTCERYLSGSIGAAEMPIVAARDQRIMVSILAIEQLTGSITPRALSISSGGSASTGLDPTDLVKAIATARAAVTAADDDVTAKTKKANEADAAAGTCATLRKKKTDTPTAVTTEESNKIKACDDADKALAEAKAKRDQAQTHYDALVAASKGAIGVSSATTSGKLEFAGDSSRPEAVAHVADTVRYIVQRTFDQDETQLFCIRTLYDDATSRETELRDGCREYLLVKVRSEQRMLAAQYHLNLADVQAVQTASIAAVEQRNRVSRALNRCAASADGAARMKATLSADAALAHYADPLIAAARISADAVSEYLFELSQPDEARLVGALATTCSLGW